MRKGVFATRSPFRPNHLGLSCVRLEKVEQHPRLGIILHVSGADLMDGTPVFDIKPYLPYVESHPGAAGGFTDQIERSRLAVWRKFQRNRERLLQRFWKTIPDRAIRRIPTGSMGFLMEAKI